MEEQEEYSVEEILDTPEGKKTLLYQSRKAGEAWRYFFLHVAYALKIDVLVGKLADLLDRANKRLE